MENRSYSFGLRLLAMLLCAVMLVPSVLVPASAAETAEPAAEVSIEPAAEISTESAQEESAVSEETEAEWALPDCDCGNTDSDLSTHADGCAQKSFLQTFTAESTAEEIYAHWEELPENAQAFILDYLQGGGWDPEKLEALNALIENGGSGSDDQQTPVEDTVTAPDGETVVKASGIPAGSSLSLAEVSDETRAIVEEFVAAQGDDSAQELFAWDISLVNGENAEVQPDGVVRVELEIPGVTLHKYAEVYVVHVDDNGEASTIAAQVTENGGIAFETEGFSVFAGFTVDFEYDGEAFSIPGRSTILLSEVFDLLKMPLYVTDVANVTFSDETLVTVTQQDDGDWLLTSLAAFTTTEKLTVTMNDGTVYEINVTDDTYVTISFNSSGNLDGGTLGVVEWYLIGTGSSGQAYSAKTSTSSYAPGWTEDYDIYIDGTNATNKDFEIVLQRHSSASGRILYLDLHTIRIEGGANLTFRLGATITKDNTDQIVIRMVRGYKDDDSSKTWWFNEMF